MRIDTHAHDLFAAPFGSAIAVCRIKIAIPCRSCSNNNNNSNNNNSQKPGEAHRKMAGDKKMEVGIIANDYKRWF